MPADMQTKALTGKKFHQMYDRLRRSEKYQKQGTKVNFMFEELAMYVGHIKRSSNRENATKAIKRMLSSRGYAERTYKRTNYRRRRTEQEEDRNQDRECCLRN